VDDRARLVRRKKNGLLTLTAEGVTGYGEAAANKRWNQSYETSEAAFARVKAAVAGLSPWEHLTWLERAEKEAGPDTEIVAALDLALWDWKGKKLNWRCTSSSEFPGGLCPSRRSRSASIRPR
jgi:L-alanine-DL-glutamate epimerase-like enolase superfamily enzyme